MGRGGRIEFGDERGRGEGAAAVAVKKSMWVRTVVGGREDDEQGAIDDEQDGGEEVGG